MAISNVPDGPRKMAFKAFVRELRANALLANDRVIKTWRIWDGQSDVAIPTVDMMPCLGLRLVSGPIERWSSEQDGGFTTVTLKTMPSILMELWVKGTDQGDVHNIYDLIDSILYPVDQDARGAIKDRFNAVGIYDWQPTKELLPENMAAFTATSIYAVGSYQLTLVLSQ